MSNRVTPEPADDVELMADQNYSDQKGMMVDHSHDPPVDRRAEIIGAGEPHGGIGCCGWILTGISWLLVFLTFPLSLCVCIKVVQEYERAVIFRLGRLLPGGAKGPGIFFVLPCIESYTKVDLRTVSFDVPPQEVLTKDSVTVSVDAVVYYRVQNATISIANVENANASTRLLAQTTLRNVLGTKNLSEILSDREGISHYMQSSLDEATDPWGIKVERVEIKDVRLPVQLQRAMAAEAEAAREARAKVIAAEGEQNASRALKEAADVIAEAPSALQLRYLQTLNTISAEKNSTIIFPLPIDLLSGLANCRHRGRATPPLEKAPSEHSQHTDVVDSEHSQHTDIVVDSDHSEHTELVINESDHSEHTDLVIVDTEKPEQTDVVIADSVPPEVVDDNINAFQ